MEENQNQKINPSNNHTKRDLQDQGNGSRSDNPHQASAEKTKLRKELSAIVESSDDAIISVSRDIRITSWNAGAETIYGYTSDEVMGCKPDFLVPEHRKNEVNDYLEDVFQDKTIRHFETERLRKDGQLIHISLSVCPLKDEQNKIIGAATIGRDISERKKSELAMRVSEEKYRSIFEYSGDGILLMKETIIDCNRQASKILGYSKEELIGCHPEKLSPAKQPDGSSSASEGKRFINQALQGKIVQFYWKHLHKNGGLVDTEITLNRIHSEEGYALVAVIRDISEQVEHQRELERRNEEIRTQNEEFQALNEELSEANKRLEQINQALASSEKKFRTLFNSASDAIFIHDFQGSILEANERGCKRLGYSRAEIMQMSPSSFESPRFARKFTNRLKKLKEKGYLFAETEHISRSGKVIATEINARVITFNEKKAVLVIARDITKRKKAEQRIASNNRELIRAKEKAEESDRLKSAFLANMSHEIRTPMNGIMGFTQLLKQPGIEGEKRNEYLEIIESRSKELMQIINDIIDISVIEANQLTLNREEMGLNDLLHDLQVFYQQSLANLPDKQINLTHYAGLNNSQSLITADHQRIRQIFSNLLSNAIKFTSSGFVHFGYELQNKDELLCYVEDTGIGIPRKAQPWIFERFRQADDSITRSFGGTGLGLAITRQLVEKQGGKIWFRSEEGEGTTFYFTLPFEPIAGNQPDDQKEGTSPEDYNWQKHTLLVVEDDPASQHLIEEILDPTHAKIVMAGNGKEALRALENGHSIALILMDLQLPDQSGLELTRRIKKSHPQIPVIAQTAYAMQQDRQKSLQAGCDDYISKPLHANQLLYKIDTLLVEKQ
jgi:PAS domain S-box-containing protein